jgi:hypothetical protein
MKWVQFVPHTKPHINKELRSRENVKQQMSLAHQAAVQQQGWLASNVWCTHGTRQGKGSPFHAVYEYIV